MNDYDIIELPSNASMDIYPNNRVSTFRVRLPILLNYSSQRHVVALTEIKLTKSWNNINEGHHVALTSYDDDEGFDGTYVSTVKHKDIMPGNYTPPELIEHLNKVMKEWEKDDSNIKSPVLEISTNDVVRLREAGILRSNDGRKRAKLVPVFDDVLTRKLGLDSESPAYLDQGLTSLFIYCDIVKPQIVGDTTAPLLRCISVEEAGEEVNLIFDSPYYLSLSRDCFQDVFVYIRTDTGEAPSFNFGRVILTLHIKPE